MQAIAMIVSRRLAIEIPTLYHRIQCRILGLNVVARGEMSSALPTLFVSNHVSYLDILALASIIEGSFIAKAEVAGWPLFGLLSKLHRTVFVERRGIKAAHHRDQILARLALRENLILFPEGTSDDGNRVLPFKSALFSVAQSEFEGRPLPVQPVSIAYTCLDGMPMGRNFRAYYAWYGDMSLASHLWAWLGLGVVTAEVTFHPPVTFAAKGSRKELAQYCHSVVAESVSESIAGRPAKALAAPPEHA